MVDNTFGMDISCGNLNIVTEIQDPEQERILVLTISLSITFTILAAILFFAIFYAWKQKSHREKTDKYARSVVVWTKRVMISMDTNNNSGSGNSGNTLHGNSENQSGCILEPRVDIQKCRATPTQFSSMANFSEYEYPCDPDWEFDRNRLNIFETLGKQVSTIKYICKKKKPVAFMYDMSVAKKQIMG